MPFSVTQSINQAVAEAGGPAFSCPTVLTQSLYLDTRLLLPGSKYPTSKYVAREVKIEKKEKKKKEGSSANKVYLLG